MIMIGENRGRITRRKACPSVTLSITYLARTDLVSNQVLRGDRPATTGLIHGTAFEVRRLCKWYLNSTSSLTEDTAVPLIQTNPLPLFVQIIL
jgi:hypothetical protein